MNSITATVTIEVLRTTFTCYQLPESMISDNAPQICLSEFAQFCHVNLTFHGRVSLHHPSLNGLAKLSVQTFKNGIKKMSEGM